ncbi:HNH endonuclease [Psychrobacter sp. F1192]|uniref:Putative HNH nuclease YajD n=2 Tax=Psychrobacter coccoides TaxID=2818440 RepID=A0ABS3NJW8_9GAMM|nr:HNH endonuclease [Psychrobacter coccoides]
MPSTPCRSYRCPNLVTKRSMKGYCDDHADQRSNWTRRPQRKGSTTERGYGHAWRKLRTQVLQRDGHLCVACERTGRYVPATDVDHIVNKASGGTDDLSNLQSLCRKCHRSKTATE